jgi:hypothetical protein
MIAPDRMAGKGLIARQIAGNRTTENALPASRLRHF